MIQPLGRKTGVQYIITVTKYLTRWEKVQPVKDCTAATTLKFLFEYVLTQFGSHKILMSDRELADRETLEEWHTQLMELLEDQFVVGFQHKVQKDREEAWHDRHINLHTFKVKNLILLYESKFTKFLGKFQTHWLGLYVVKEIMDGGAIQLMKLNGKLFPGRVNGIWLKLYTGDHAPAQ
eukprot:PITA_03520